MEAGWTRALQELARQEFAAKMLCEIAQDMAVCKLEGWDVFGFPELLKKEIDRICEKKCLREHTKEQS